jgi:CHAT domain-containing protein
MTPSPSVPVTAPSLGEQTAPASSDSSSDIESPAADWWRRMAISGPMRRSGIALADANLTVMGQQPFGDRDGLLTAEEVCALDLRGTRLVTLSACDTGLGQILGAEGVFGLRRAFQIAGAECLVLSLWRVEDQATSAIMSDMYAKLVLEVQPAAALTLAQRQWLNRQRSDGQYPHPFFWAGFVASGLRDSLESAASSPP